MKYAQIAILCMVMLLLVGCGGRTQPVTQKELRVGTQGLSLRWVPDSRPIEVFENDLFNVDLDIKNEGAYDVRRLFLISGFEEDYLEMTARYFEKNLVPPKSNDVTPFLRDGVLPGKSPKLSLGGNAYVESEWMAKRITLSKIQETTLSAIACYDYHTLAEASVCIQPKNSMLGLQKACEAKDITLSSQGGPLAITSIKVNNNVITGNVIRSSFRIMVEHKGKGNVIRWNTAQEVCSAKAVGTTQVWNYFHIRAQLGKDVLKCRYKKWENGYLVRLKDNKAEVLCELEVPISAGYTRPLLIELFYDYTEAVTRKVKIEKII